jgi:hypothetical protein
MRRLLLLATLLLTPTASADNATYRTIWEGQVDGASVTNLPHVGRLPLPATSPWHCDFSGAATAIGSSRTLTCGDGVGEVAQSVFCRVSHVEDDSATFRLTRASSTQTGVIVQVKCSTELVKP